MTGKQIVLNNIINDKLPGLYNNIPETIERLQAKKERQIRILKTLKKLL